MAKVNFKVGTSAWYTGLQTRDTNTLYFLSDTHQIYKGEDLYADGHKSNFIVVDGLPASNQEEGIVYFVPSTKTGSTWNGSGWDIVIQDTQVEIINDLTTGGTDKALSAEQGKTLKTQLDTHTGKKAGTTSADTGHVYVDNTTMKVGSDGKLSVGAIPESSITGLTDKLDTYAPKNNPTFTGTVTLPSTAPTADTQAVNKKYVDDQDEATLESAKEYADSILGANDAMVYKGTIGTGGTVTALPNSHEVGWTYKVITAGTYAGQKCEIGDMIICVTKGTTAKDSDWTVVQNNVDGAVIGPASAVANRVAVFDGTTGKLIKDSGYTIASNVPSGAKFTDTTYTVDAPVSKANGAVTIDLVGSDSSKDSISVTGAGSTTVTPDETGKVVITSTDKDTTYTMSATAKSGGGATVTLTPSEGDDVTFDIVGGDGISVSVADSTITIESTVDLPIASDILLTGYTKAAAAAAIAPTDNVSVALGKLEKALDGKAATSHNQASNTINAMTGYTKGTSAEAITATDSLNTAIGKLENKVDNANVALEWGTI